jgi:hypothetical protein
MTLPILMAGSGAFGRSLGQTRFEAMLAKYPDILNRPEVTLNNIEGMIGLFINIEGFGEIFARQAATKFHKFIAFLCDLDESIVIKEKPQVAEVTNRAAIEDLRGKNVCLTGFRDAKISDLMAALGGKLQSGVNGKTDILVIKNIESQSAKTMAAQANGVVIITKEEFYRVYMSAENDNANVPAARVQHIRPAAIQYQDQIPIINNNNTDGICTGIKKCGSKCSNKAKIGDKCGIHAKK